MPASCQRSTLAALGALGVERRDFASAGGVVAGVKAGQLLATFPNADEAERAYETILGWRTTCRSWASAHGYDTSKLGDLQDVHSNATRSAWWLGTFGPAAEDPDAGWFSADGVAVDADTVTLVWIDVLGQDYDYDAGAEPMVTTLVNASAVVG